MSRKIKIAGLDLALRNAGYAVASYDLDTGEVSNIDLILVKTTKQAGKNVRVSSDDLRAAREMYSGFRQYTDGCAMVITEVPTGGQSAAAAKSFGIVIGALAACPAPIIEVTQQDVKQVIYGPRKGKQPTKEEIIAYATAKYPDAPWLTKTEKGVTRLINDNEHLADAILCIEAGVRTEQFKASVAGMKQLFAA